MKTSKTRQGILAVLALCAAAASAGPVTTVPWNGHPGAVSFTFDDALQTQLDNVVPALKARGIHATFFLYDVGGTFTNNKAKWVAAAKDGNELANHSVNHADFSKSIDAAYQVGDMASRLRKSDASVEAVTFAYPYCAIGYESAVGAENIIGRGCLFGAPYQPLLWKNPPSNWNNVGAIYVGDDATATGPTLAALDAAKNGGWITVLNHGVGGDWVAVSKANVLAMFDRALANKLWVGTYQEVAAYWRAALAMDKAGASGAGPWTLSWTSPHPKMPRSVKLKVKLDAAAFGSDIVVSQAGTAIPANSDGSYTVEFMKLSLNVAKGSTVSVKSRMHAGAVRVRWSEGKLQLQGTADARMRLADLQGRTWEFQVAGGTAPAALLPNGIYRAWIDGAQDASGIVTVLR